MDFFIHYTLLLQLSSIVECQSVAEDVIFVIPKDVKKSTYLQEQLYTINELATDSTRISSNTAIQFLPGRHITGDTDHRETTLHLSDIHKITLAGTCTNGTSCTVPVVECTGPFALVFSFVTNLTISHLSFINCGAYYHQVSKLLPATIVIENCRHVEVERVTITNGTGVGLFALKVLDYLRISSSTMTHNNINCYIGDRNSVFDPLAPVLYEQSSSFQLIIINSEFSHGRLLEEDTNGTRFKSDASGITAFFFSFETIQVSIINVTLDSNEACGGNFRLEKHPVSEHTKSESLIVSVQWLTSVNAMGKMASSLSILYKSAKWVNVTIADSTFAHKGITIGSAAPPSELCTVFGISDPDYHGVFLNNVSIHNTTANYQKLQFSALQASLHLYHLQNAFLKNVVLTGNALPLSVSVSDSFVTLQEHNIIRDNRGGIVIENNSTLTAESYSITSITCNLLTNRELSLSVLLLHKSKMTMDSDSIVHLANNSVLGCGGVMAINSTISFRRNVSLIVSDSEGYNGGAMALYDKSQLFFTGREITIKFLRNRARNKGGALFVDDSSYKDSINFKYILAPIVFQYELYFSKIIFINNTADIAGDDIYGGWIFWPYKEIKEYTRSQDNTCTTEYYSFEYVYSSSVFFISSYQDSLSSVTSDPVRICLCFDSTPNCNVTNHTVWMFPGQTLQLEAVAVGQQYGVVPATVIAEFQNLSVNFVMGQNVQSVGRYCSPLEYTVISGNMFESILLHPSGDPDSSPNLPRDEVLRQSLNSTKPDNFAELYLLFSQLSLSIHLKPCPLGYVFNLTSNNCTCHHSLQSHGISCNTSDFSIWRPANKWINATIVHTSSSDELVVIVHDHCPLDYCNRESHSLQLETPDDQCYFNRSGTLCGACGSHLSQVFGTSSCKPCSSLWVLLLVPVFMLLGAALVVFLMVLDITVSIGTINGLIFYANIVRANQAVFFPADSANSFLSWFIAWLNLDLGIESCFYNGLDAYVKSWLQFLFPVYIWLLVTAIIVSSRYSIRVSRVIGTNAVSVLATLFLLSYTKVLRSIITVFQYTELEYSNGDRKKVWLYDGNVEYLRGKHIPLFVSALFFLIFLSFPYTATLVEVQWLRRVFCTTCDRCLKLWAGKFMPILDAHSGPYKDSHRYWTGLLLLVRVVLLLVFSLNVSGDPSVNLIAISVTILCLVSYFSLLGGPYREWPMNVIEVSFYLNTGLLSSATLYKVKGDSKGNSPTVTFTSTSIAVISFTVIVCYHVYKRLVSTRRGTEGKKAVCKRMRALFRRQEAEDTRGNPLCKRAPKETATRTVIELREPLLNDIVRND